MYGDGTIWLDSKRKKYCYDYCDNTGKRHKKRFSSEKEAKDFKKLIRAQRDKGQLTSSTTTVGDWVVEFLETYKKPVLRSSSYARQKQSAQKLMTIANIPLDKLTGTDVQKLYNSYSDVLSTSSISKMHKLLFEAYKKAVALRMIDHNPMSAVASVKVKYKEMSVFSFAELIRIFRVLRTDQYYNKYYTLFYMLLVLGCRIGELLAIKWEYVDLKSREIYIKDAKSGTGQEFHEPKTKAGKRYIPIVYDKCLDRLKKMQHQGNIIRISGFLFQTDSGKALYYGNIRRAWLKICEKADVDPAKTVHTFRHTFATAALAKGIPILEVSRILGHADATTTLKMYGHAIPGYNQHLIQLFQKKKTKTATKSATNIS